jgi:16S rRNA (guanine966-N2)-methyltransferase
MDTLRPWLTDASVLDLYAGQGRFGISALEEGAKGCLFIEQHARTARELESALEASDSKVLSTDVFRFLESTAEHFDIVFADPPFSLWNKEYEIKLLTRVVKVLNPGSIFLVKHPKRVVLSSPSEDLKHWKTSVFGESGLTYFRYGEES